MHFSRRHTNESSSLHHFTKCTFEHSAVIKITLPRCKIFRIHHQIITASRYSRLMSLPPSLVPPSFPLASRATVIHFWGVIVLGRSTMVPRINRNTLYHMNAIGCEIIISPISPFLSDSAHFQPSRMFSASWKLRYLH